MAAGQSEIKANSASVAVDFVLDVVPDVVLDAVLNVVLILSLMLYLSCTQVVLRDVLHNLT